MKPGKKPRVTYDRDFILNAVRLCIEDGRQIREVARTLNVHPMQVYRWKREYEKDPNNAFPGKGHLKPANAELRQLKRELASVKQQRDILKKALAIFSKEPRKYTNL